VSLVGIRRRPHLPLFPPVEDGGDWAEHVLADRVAAMLSQRQEEDGLLDIGREAEQVHDLGDAGAGDVAQPGDLGIVVDLAALQEIVRPDGQGHEARKARHPPRRKGGRLRPGAFGQQLAPAAAVPKMDLPDDGDGPAHAGTSCCFASSTSDRMPVG